MVRASSVRATTRHNDAEKASRNETAYQDSVPDQGVREPSILQFPRPETNRVESSLAHRDNGVIAQLNARWRVVDHELQWILQRRKGNPRPKNSGWSGRSFCTTQDALLHCVFNHCGDVDPNEFAKLVALPWHHDLQNLDVHGTDQAQADNQAKSLITKDLGVCGADDYRPDSTHIVHSLSSASGGDTTVHRERIGCAALLSLPTAGSDKATKPEKELRTSRRISLR